jgi:hypothetical protein
VSVWVVEMADKRFGWVQINPGVHQARHLATEQMGALKYRNPRQKYRVSRYESTRKDAKAKP